MGERDARAREDATERTTEMTMLAAEGARVGIVTCLECGVAILIDPRETGINAVDLHRGWHERLELRGGP